MEYWDKDYERSIIWNDKDIKVDWPLEKYKINLESAKKIQMA